jgi:hypothetical protein
MAKPRKKLQNKLKNVKKQLRNDSLSASQKAALDRKRLDIKQKLAAFPSNGNTPETNKQGEIPTTVKPSKIGPYLEEAAAQGEGLTNQLAPELKQDQFLGNTTNPYAAQVQELMDRLRQTEQSSQQISPELQDIIARQQSGLNGFTTPEEEALKFSAIQNIDAQLRSGLRAAAGLNMSRGLSGGVAANNFAPALAEAIRSRQGLSNDIFTQQIAERARRLGEYQNTITSRDQSMFDRRNQALTMQQGTLERQQVLDQQMQEANLERRRAELAARLGARGMSYDAILNERNYRQERQDYKNADNQYREDLASLMG